MTKLPITSARRIAEPSLTAKIREGRLAPDQRLPTEPVLMTRFKVGRRRIRRALAELEARILVWAHQGGGAHVWERGVLVYHPSELTHFSRSLLGPEGANPWRAAV